MLYCSLMSINTFDRADIREQQSYRNIDLIISSLNIKSMYRKEIMQWCMTHILTGILEYLFLLHSMRNPIDSISMRNPTVHYLQLVSIVR